MSYPIKKKKLPRKNTDEHNIYGILRAINEQFHIDNELLKIGKNKFNAYITNLIKDNCIQRINGKEQDDFNPEDFTLTLNGVKACKKIKNHSVSADIVLPFFKFTLGTKF